MNLIVNLVYISNLIVNLVCIVNLIVNLKHSRFD